MSKHSCLIYNPAQIVQVVSHKQPYLRGGSQDIKDLAILESDGDHNNKLCLVAIDGVIEFVGTEQDPNFVNNFKSIQYDLQIDATGCSILPGLVDSHTHPVWEGDRINEFKMKLEGATYMDIHKAGGGINYSVQHTKNASEEALYQSLEDRLMSFVKSGTTFAECKSGYGLEWDTELKLLRVLTRAKQELKSKISLSNTYLGAHAVPRGKTADEATEDIVNYQLTELKKCIDSKEVDVDNIDVFCEKGVFDVEQSEAILKKGKESLGLQINFHSDELYPLNSVEMGVKLQAKGVSHLEEISDHEIDLLAKSETVGILLPTTAFIMQLPRPPARKMLNAGCIVALGSDFNPNAYCYSMPLVMHLACADLRLTMNEALAASTINSAFALGVEKTRGSIEAGKQADLVILRTRKWENIIYQLGAHESLIRSVIVNGRLVFTKSSA